MPLGRVKWVESLLAVACLTMGSKRTEKYFESFIYQDAPAEPQSSLSILSLSLSLSLSPPSKCYHLMAPVLMINSWFVLTMWLFGGTAFLLSQLLSISLVLTILFLFLLLGVVALVFFFVFNQPSLLGWFDLYAFCYGLHMHLQISIITLHSPLYPYYSNQTKFD